MFELDNRQVATLIWVLVIVMLLILWPQTRRAAWPALKEVLRAMATWKIIVPIITYFTYAALAVFITYKIDIWHEYPATDALIIVLFVGLPMFANAFREKGGDQLLKKTLRNTIGASALIAFYVALAPLSLAGELVVQLIIGVLTIFSIFAGRSAEYNPAKKLFDGALVVIGLWLIVRTAVIIISSWQIKDVVGTTDALTLSILLPLLLLPAVYIFALIMRYEMIFMVSKNFNNGKKMSMSAKLACLIGMSIQLGPLNSLGGIWLQKLNEASSFREALSVTSTLKRAYRKQRRKNKNRNKRLYRMKCAEGVDENGLQLDRREFYESKYDLEILFYNQMAQFKNTKGYNPDLPIQIGYSKLPDNHGITIKVQKDKKAWYAWRQMPSGYYFGVGGSSTIDDMWIYDGPVQPSSFPSSTLNGWHLKREGSTSFEWQHDDSPAQTTIPEAYFA